MGLEILHEYQPDVKTQLPAAVMWFSFARPIWSEAGCRKSFGGHLTCHLATLVSSRIPLIIGDQGDALCYVIDTADSIDPAALIQISERDDTGAG